MRRPAQFDRELTGAGIKDRFADPCAWGLIEGEELLLRTDQDSGGVVQAEVPHGLAEFKHPLRGGLEGGEDVTLRGDLQSLFDDFLYPWR